MAYKMAVNGLRHKRSRLAGEIAKLEAWNRRNLRKIAELQACVASNAAKISVYLSQIDDLGTASMIGFEVELSSPTPRQTNVCDTFWNGVEQPVRR